MGADARLNREELAWAAGFFDGEGTTRRRSPGRRGRLVPILQLAQTDPGVLIRFQSAVGGLGRVYGPYLSKQANRRPYWVWASNSFEHGQATMAMLWAFLSAVKRKQISDAFIGYHNTPAKRSGPPSKAVAA